MATKNGIFSLILAFSVIFSVFILTGCEIADTTQADQIINTIDENDSELMAEAEAKMAEEAAFEESQTDEASRGLFSDKGYASSGIGLSTTEFNNVWQMANLTAIVYHDLWDKALAAISTTLIPSLDFKGNASRYRVVQTYAGNAGFYAELFKNIDTNAYVLVYRGTNPLSITDWVQDLTQALSTYTGITASQYKSAVDLARNVKSMYSPLQIAGHSLGGGLAQIAALDTGLKATCFNAAGLSQGTLNYFKITSTKLTNNKKNIFHYNVKYCPLADTRGYMNTKAPDLAIFDTYQYGARTRWLRNIRGTAFTLNPFRTINHVYHAYVYLLKNTYKYSGNFIK